MGEILIQMPISTVPDK